MGGWGFAFELLPMFLVAAGDQRKPFFHRFLTSIQQMSVFLANRPFERVLTGEGFPTSLDTSRRSPIATLSGNPWRERSLGSAPSGLLQGKSHRRTRQTHSATTEPSLDPWARDQPVGFRQPEPPNSGAATGFELGATRLVLMFHLV